ncbi:glycosyltransferase family 2 protein [Sphingobacterium sp. HJSM2_6]|uniref:glycosyltransferase family 2 protein n=1 Tax=Sphingobacterium sp. HJSM2_6 TaxID=3366264 RepID=UPI003BE10472
MISVALCTFNGIKFLDQQLESILSQTVSVDEIVICDDGSTDGSKDLLSVYRSKYPNIIKLFFNETSLGTSKNFELAISKTNGDYIFLSDQDDLWVEDKVKKTLAYFEENISKKMVFTNGLLIDDYGNDLNNSLFEKFNFSADVQKQWLDHQFVIINLINRTNKITGATVCFKKELKESFLPINTPCNFWHDAWIGLHAAKYNELGFLTDCLIKYRIHENQQVGVNINNKDDHKSTGCKSKESEFLAYLKRDFKDYIPYYDNGSKHLIRRIYNKIF